MNFENLSFDVFLDEVQKGQQAVANELPIDADEAAAVAAALVGNNRLKELHLYNNGLKETSIEQIINGLESNYALQTLSIMNNGIGFRSCSLLRNFLLNNRHLRVLNLYFNNIGDPEVELLSIGLLNNFSLQELCLHYNKIGNLGCDHLAKVLATTFSLSTLRLNNNANITDRGAKVLLKALKSNDLHTLHTLNLDGIHSISTRTKISIMGELGQVPNNRKNELASKEFLETLNSNEKESWNRSRLMFVGQGAAGKTSTVRSLLGMPFNPDWDSTIGASVSETETSVFQNAWINVGNKTSDDMARKFAARIMIRNRKRVMEAREENQEARKVHHAKFNGNTVNLLRNRRMSDLRSKVYNQLNNKAEANTLIRNREDNTPTGNTRKPNAPYNIMQKKVEPQEIVKQYDRFLLFEANRDEKLLTLSLWDFGGQKVFYAMHHIFMTETGLYLLIFDMRELIQENKQDEALKYILFWLKSINLHAPSAPVLIVGTFLHEIKEARQIKYINNLLKGFPTDLFTQLARNDEQDLLFFPIDNKESLGIASLRVRVEGIVREDQSVLQEVPMKWLVLLDEILNKRTTESYLTLSSVKTIAANIGITSGTEQEKALQLYHERGMLIHLTSTSALKEIVTIKPQWLIDNISKVIRDDSIHMFDIAELKKQALLDEVMDMFSHALATTDVLEYVWQKDEVEFFVDLMKRTLLMSDWNFGGKENRYLIPSLLKNSYHDIKGNELGIRCVFDFNFLPNGVFERLLCLCIAYSTSSRSSHTSQSYSGDEPELYKNFCSIDFGPKNKLQIHADEESENICFHMENSKYSERNLAIISSMMQKLNNDFMGTGLNWTVFLEDISSGKLISYNKALVNRLSPWFQDSATKRLDTSDRTKNRHSDFDLGLFLDNL